MDRSEQLRDELTFVERMVAECEIHIPRLKQAIVEMSQDGQDTDLARDVLATFVRALTRHEAQRKLLLSMMAASPHAKQKRAPSR